MAAGTITDEFCGWPYFQPYQFTQKAPRKKRASKRSTIAKDLRTPKYKPTIETSRSITSTQINFPMRPTHNPRKLLLRIE